MASFSLSCLSYVNYNSYFKKLTLLRTMLRATVCLKLFQVVFLSRGINRTHMLVSLFNDINDVSEGSDYSGRPSQLLA